MYKKDIRRCILLMILCILISIWRGFELSENDKTNFITFITVYLGFIMTTFSILSGNEEVKKLNMKKDPEDNYLMLNYRLLNYFKYTFVFGLSAVFLLLISDMLGIDFITSKIILSLLVCMGLASYTPTKILSDIFLNKIVV